MAILDEPYEYLDLSDGASISLRVNRYLDGTAVIHPRVPTPRHVRQHMDQRGLQEAPAPGTPISIETPVLRLWGERLDEPSNARYWDISSKVLRADLLARFYAGLMTPVMLTLTANGYAPRKRYSVQIGHVF